MYQGRNRLLLLIWGLLLLTSPAARADDWPQWLGPQRDGVWREKGILARFPKEGPKKLWSFPLGGGYAGPAVADGKVYITDRVLDPGQADPDNPFARTDTTGKERVFCLEADTGKQVWKFEYPCTYTMAYPCGPRATPVVSGGKVYTFGAMGNLHCLDAKTGKPVWSKDFVKDYGADVAVWGFAAHPLLDGDQLICLVGRNPAVISLDKDTGKEKWRALKITAAEIGYCPPMIYTFHGKRHLVIWHPEGVYGLEPETGKQLWSHRWGVKANLTIPTPRQVEGNRLFLTSFYNGCRLLEITADNEVKEIYRSKGRGETPGETDMLHAIMPTPFIKGEHIYGVCSYGELRCLNLKDGKRIWADLTATGAGGKPVRWGNAFLVENGDRFFLFNELGELIIAKLTPKGYEQVDKAKLLDPTGVLAGGRLGKPRKVVWSHPAFANKTIFARNDKEIVAYSLAE